MVFSKLTEIRKNTSPTKEKQANNILVEESNNSKIDQENKNKDTEICRHDYSYIYIDIYIYIYI